jgi:dephospho-CoA kinase
MRKVIAVVGMTGSGKSEAARIFRESGFAVVRFGDITDGEVKKRGLELNEANERRVREMLREEHGMVAYAKLNLTRIDTARREAHVVVDGLYSWEEYLFLKKQYGDDFVVVGVWASPRTRYARLGERPVRPLTPQEAASRDRAEIENLDKGGPIAMADYTILNEASFEEMEREVKRIIAGLR